jgi:hypothetical protein
VAASVLQFGTADPGSVTLTGVTAGSILHAWVNGDASSSTISVSDNRNGAWSAQLDATVNNGRGDALGQFRFVNTVSGTVVITPAQVGSPSFLGITVIEIGGVSVSGSPPDQHKTNDQSAPGTGTDAQVVSDATSPSGNFTNSAQPALIVALGYDDSSGIPPTAGTGFTSAGVGMFAICTVESKRITTVAAQSATFTNAGGEGVTIAAIYLEAAGATAVVEGPRLRANPAFHLLGPGRFRAPRLVQSPGGTVPPATAITLALTGVSATSAVGSVTPSFTIPTTGAAATGAVGTLTPSSAVGLTGNGSTSAAGTVVPAFSLSITGDAAGSAVGSAVVSFALALSGAASSSSVGNLAAVTGLTGNSGTGSAGSTGPQFAIGLTGAAASSAVGSMLTVSSAALTGDGATGSVGTLGPGMSFALTGAAASAAVGTVAPVFALALTGDSATGSAGSLVPGTTVGLTGMGAAGAAGNVTVFQAGTAALSGTSSTGSAGSPSVSLTVALAGNGATAATGNLGAAISPAPLAGNSAASAVGGVTSSRAFLLSGVSAAGAVGTVGVISNSTVALSGVQVTGSVGTMVATGFSLQLPTLFIRHGNVTADRVSPDGPTVATGQPTETE